MKQSLTGQFLLLIVAGLLTTPAIAYADSILLIDGTKHDGIITAITDVRIILSKNYVERRFLRLFVREILFEKSDILVLVSGDTLTGRILQQTDGRMHVTLRDGMRTVDLNEVTRVLRLEGPSFNAGDVVPTDDSFRYDDPNTPATPPPIQISVSLGTQDITYNSVFSSFDESLRGSLVRVEVGTNIHRSVDLMIGASWCTAQFINYSSFHASGLFSIHALKNRMRFFARIQAGFHTGSTQYEEGELTATIIPGAGIMLSPVPFAQLILEADVFISSLSLDQTGNTMGRGLMLWAGVRFDFSVFSTGH
ncbi:MAG: hypothetical protein WEB37_00690 [Bacteroidota bacterium]